MEKRVDKLEEKVDQLSGDIRQLITVVSQMNDHEQRIRQIELERAKESTAREWLNKNWVSLAIIIAIMVSESAILAKLL